ncbi:MAG: sigma 54-interacting transcriptional regulator [Thermoanaerobaculales bacterium]|nr:sigma 54-interacting transcriptional regulator [Thermoanaerobaculales bacterium]
MTVRLVVRIGDRVNRFPLDSREQVVGSGGDADLRLGHPTVSRRHASVAVSDGGVVVVDLGSSNGTRVDGSKIDEPTIAAPGTPLRFGSVEATVEQVGQDDLETGIEIPGAPVAVHRRQDVDQDEPPSTIGPTVLEAFSLGYLPELVERLARGDGRDEVARAVGAALLRSLPCRRVEVLQPTAGKAGVLFTGERETSDPITEVTVSAGDGVELRVAFPGAALASAFQPLLRAAAALVSAAGARVAQDVRSPVETREPPRLPDPPTLVPTVREIYEQAARIAPSRVSVLIRGESGTGKELLARYLHAASDRADQPLVTLNCAALPRDLLESELFGVERGVATGVDARAGKFESANGGTLFLDEIGDMAPETQARILRVLAEGEVYRIGGHDARPADVRVLSATNRDIELMLDDGDFRSDLYHRISDWVVELPPLRERRADIPNLAAHFLGRACVERGVQAAGISRAALTALRSYDWPGNVRQLEREMGRAALFVDDGGLLESSRLQSAFTEGADADSAADDLKTILERAEKSHIERVLGECGGDVPAAAERLGVGVSTLYRRMKQLVIS